MHTRSEDFFVKINPKRRLSSPEQMRILKNSQKINKRRITIQKRSRIMMVLLIRLKKRVRTYLVFFVKFAKGLITMQKNVGTKASPNVTFVKKLTTLRRIVGTSNGSKQISVKNRRKKRKKTFSFLLTTKCNEWYVDSDCSNHMTGDEKAFLSINIIASLLK